jgi:hypothetical protein
MDLKSIYKGAHLFSFRLYSDESKQETEIFQVSVVLRFKRIFV